MTVAAYARALVRHRDGLAKLLERQCIPGFYPGPAARADDPPVSFDVAAARAYARELIALEVEHAVFTDWTMAMGKGPDNREPGAFVDTRWRCIWCHSLNKPRSSACAACDSDLWAEQMASRAAPSGGWPGKLAREWPGDRRAPQGRSLARVGRRLLAALEGQPDECQACDGKAVETQLSDTFERAPGFMTLWAEAREREGFTVVWKPYYDVRRFHATRDCPYCHGTGHNLRGYLPEVEVTPSMMAALADGGVGTLSQMWPKWARGLGISRLDVLELESGQGEADDETPWTRVVPRGEHRDVDAVREEWSFGRQPSAEAAE